MTAGQTITPVTAEAVEEALLAFLAERIKTEVAPDQDLFASGLASSMFAMQLVVPWRSPTTSPLSALS